ncbi:MAG: hypothetical protein UT32_C0009G0028 [Parcubacteria group bacterium GW2011_GWC2_39_14]|nr:MAG: hypothetical protein UT32_C0009G0028 [Parcubacteria group bacterium GW2011_GWC2_39_14]KKR55367.1 MAG: hypothetical protein UT91_C0002G0028 [Parcubacteria group bacterium GW2011_GWA2_40_23]
MRAGLVDRFTEFAQVRRQFHDQKLKTQHATAAVQNHLLVRHLDRPHGTAAVRLVEHEVRSIDSLASPAGLKCHVDHQIDLTFTVRKIEHCHDLLSCIHGNLLDGKAITSFYGISSPLSIPPATIFN